MENTVRTNMGNVFTTLHYHTPGTVWEDCLPLGNGRIGAMVDGIPHMESLFLNEDSLWSGYPDQTVWPNTAAGLPYARKLIREKRFQEADHFISAAMLGFAQQSYLPAGILKLKFTMPENTFREYKRSLDIDSALLQTSFNCGNTHFLREYFISNPAQISAIRLQADSPGVLTFRAFFESEMKGCCRVTDNLLIFEGSCPFCNSDRFIESLPDGTSGIHYAMVLEMRHCGGRVVANADSIEISCADSAELRLAIRSDFINWKTAPGTGVPSPVEFCRRDLISASTRSWDALKEEHCRDHRSLFRRVKIEFPAGKDDMQSTDERLKLAEKNPETARNLSALLFNYGRYLLIAASRKHTQPMNLQGIWNHRIKPPWHSAYTTNINLEMNYFASESTALPECMEPLFQYIDECAESGSAAAHGLYGCRGWCLHHTSDIWRKCTPAGRCAQSAFWPMGGIWLCHHLFEHYEYSGDTLFLRRHFPALKGAAEFLLDFLTEDENGRLTTSPSTSPENGFIDPSTGLGASVCSGSLCDLSLCRELFENLLETKEFFSELAPESFFDSIRKSLEYLPMPAIGSEGQLLEFGDDYDEYSLENRHLSHLYGLYPGEEFYRNPKMLEAAGVSLQRRGDEATGWGMAWRALLWARLGDGNHAEKILYRMMRVVSPDAGELSGGGFYSNLFGAHPPFQIDGNSGFTAAVAEMLLRSRKEPGSSRLILEILPALPTDWMQGKITGLKGKQGITANIIWQQPDAEAVLLSADFVELEFRGGTSRQLLYLKPNHPVKVNFKLSP